MILYDKKESSVDFYNVNVKLDELKKYRQMILDQYYYEKLFFVLRSNWQERIKLFEDSDDIDIKLLNYDDTLTVQDVNTWCFLTPMGRKITYCESQCQQEAIEKYINGEYDSIVPTNVFINRNGIKKRFRLLLETEPAKVICQNKGETIWEVNNIMNLPDDLYLLHLFINGQYDKLSINEIDKFLPLVDLDYLGNTNLLKTNEENNSIKLDKQLNLLKKHGYWN